MRLAVQVADTLLAARTAPPDVAVLRLATALAARDSARADASVTSLAKGPLDFLAVPLRAWLAVDRRGGDPIAILDAAPVDGLARRFVAENRALLLIATHRPAEGVAALRPLIAADGGASQLRFAAARLLACTGHRDDAAALLEGHNAEGLRTLTRRKGCRIDAAFGARQLFVRVAAEVSAGDSAPLAIVLTRSALILDPNDDRARLVLAGALANDEAEADALAVLDAIPRGSAFAGAAAAQRIAILDGTGRASEALELARASADGQAANGNDIQRLGDLLFAAGRYDEAAEAYARASAATPRPADWILALQRGSALERAGKWSEAKPLLQRAAQLAPDEPAALNALGYAQADRGEALPVARALLERALKLRPNDPSITDSLAWAYLRSGETARALPMLESAARARPTSAEINEHLGDAYWMLGRRYEARYAWRAAAVVASAGPESTRIMAKIAQGPR